MLYPCMVIMLYAIHHPIQAAPLLLQHVVGLFKVQQTVFHGYFVTTQPGAAVKAHSLGLTAEAGWHRLKA